MIFALLPYDSSSHFSLTLSAHPKVFEIKMIISGGI